MEKYRNIQRIIILFIFSVGKGLSRSELGLSRYRSYQPYLHFQNLEIKHENSTTSINHLIYNDIELAIKSIYPNSNINKIINLMFNLNNSNYEYVFEFPGKFGKKLVMHRDDFQNPIFPNLTKPYIELAQISRRMYDFNRIHQIPKKSHKESTWLQTTIKYDENLLSDKSDDDLSGAIITNLVTERNFINYMENLNNKGEQYMKKIYKTNGAPSPTNEIKKIDIKIPKKNLEHMTIISNNKSVETHQDKLDNSKNEWSALGLDGWEGALMPPKYLNSPNSFQQSPTISPEVYIFDSNKNHKDISEIHLTLTNQYNFLDNDENNIIWDLPGKISLNQPLLKELFERTENDETLKNLTKLFRSVSKPNWPITVKRNEHNNNDIYIARANDPFGHSTKWKLKNNTKSNSYYSEHRNKRSVLNLYSMIKCSTGCDPIIFKGYGCFCGFMGNGIPVDGIDQCCYMHDKCYGNTNCPSHLNYFIPYLWKCYYGKPLCATSHGEWGGRNSCAANLCECDLKLSRCLRKFICPNRRAICRSSNVRLLQNYLMIL